MDSRVTSAGFAFLTRRCRRPRWGVGLESAEVGRPGHVQDVRAYTKGLAAQVAQVAAGWGFTCARKKDGSVWCWGSNLFGALGDGGSWAWHEKPVVVDLR